MSTDYRRQLSTFPVALQLDQGDILTKKQSLTVNETALSHGGSCFVPHFHDEDAVVVRHHHDLPKSITRQELQDVLNHVFDLANPDFPASSVLDIQTYCSQKVSELMERE